MSVLFQNIWSDEGCRSYVVADSRTGKGIWIDPSLAAWNSCSGLMEKWGLKDLLITDTHTHADHFSASAELASAARASGVRCEILMSNKTSSKRATRKVADGDSFDLGEGLSAMVLETPGHTKDSICWLLKTPDKGVLLFTGDTLLIGAAGRTDFPGASPEELFSSLREKLWLMSDSTWIFPGHDYSGLLFSTIGVEREQNQQFAMAGVGEQAAFVNLKKEELLDALPIVTKIVDFNCAESPKSPLLVPSAAACAAAAPTPDVKAVSVDEFHETLKSVRSQSACALIDVREPEEFTDGHLPGLENAPLSMVWARWPELRCKEEVYFSCKSGKRSEMVSKSFARMGLQNAVNVTGGFLEWSAKGYSIER